MRISPTSLRWQEVAELFEGVGFEPIGLVDDDELGQVWDVDVQVDVGVALRVQCPVDVGAQGLGEQVDLEVEAPAGDVHQRRVEQGSAGDQRVWKDGAPAVPVAGPLVVVVGGGVGAGRQRLTQSGCAIAGADVTVPADRIGELQEAAMLLGDLEVHQSAGRPRPTGYLDLLSHSHCPFSLVDFQSSAYNFRRGAGAAGGAATRVSREPLGVAGRGSLSSSARLRWAVRCSRNSRRRSLRAA